MVRTNTRRRHLRARTARKLRSDISRNSIARAARNSHASFEPLESRQLLSATPALVDTAGDAPVYPIIDLNGSATGIDYTSTYEQDAPAIPIGDVSRLDISAGTTHLLSLRIGAQVPSAWYQAASQLGQDFDVLSINTTGTNITASQVGNEYLLSGFDTLENYESVLKSMRITGYSTFWGYDQGITMPLYLIATDANGLEGPRSHHLMTTLNERPPMLDLDTTSPFDVRTAETMPGQPVALVNPVALEISTNRAYPMVITGASFEFPAGTGTVQVDTSGTTIQVVAADGALELHGNATLAEYEQVLRTATFTPAAPATQSYIPVEITVTSRVITGSGSLTSPPVTSYVRITPGQAPAAPVVPRIALDAIPERAVTEVKLYADPGGEVQNQPLFQARLVDIEPSTPLTGARIDFDYAPGTIFANTAGTAITLTQSGSTLSLSGIDTPQHYEQVLQSLTFAEVGMFRGSTNRAILRVSNAEGTSAPATVLITVVLPPPRILDLDADPDRDFFTATHRAGDPAIRVVDDGLTISTSSVHNVIGDVVAEMEGGPGTFTFDTSGTFIQVFGRTDGFWLHGIDTVANYEKVLRTMKFASDVPGTRRVPIQIVTSFYQNAPMAEILIDVQPAIVPDATVVGRYLFYNHSKYDVVADDGAIAPDKSPYFAGSGVAQPQSVSSFDRGINGLMIDVADLAGEISVDDFTFKIGSTNDPSGWSLAPAPSGFQVRQGEGEGGSDRIVFTWNDGAIKNTWLQVTARGNDEAGGFNPGTGLPASDVFYFGNRVGDSFVNPGSIAFTTNAADEIGARLSPGFGLPIENVYDFDKNGTVSATDQIIARTNTGFLLRLNLPAPGTTPAVAATVANQVAQAIAMQGEPVALDEAPAAAWIELIARRVEPARALDRDALTSAALWQRVSAALAADEDSLDADKEHLPGA